MTIILGSNSFVDCPTLLAVRGQALLRVTANPLRVSLTTPPDLRSQRSVQVRDNTVSTGSADAVRVTETAKSVAIFWNTTPLVLATVTDADTVSLRVDLRPLGVNVFDDAGVFHIGGNTFSANLFRGVGTDGTAIQLA